METETKMVTECLICFRSAKDGGEHDGKVMNVLR